MRGALELPLMMALLCILTQCVQVHWTAAIQPVMPQVSFERTLLHGNDGAEKQSCYCMSAFEEVCVDRLFFLAFWKLHLIIRYEYNRPVIGYQHL